MVKEAATGALACALALCAALPCGAQAADIAVVDVARVYAESKAAQEADTHVNKVRAVLQQGMASLEKNLDERKLSQKEREAELNAGLRWKFRPPARWCTI